jgi:hypothetical protein
VPALADQINYGPVFLALLDGFDLQASHFRPTKTASQQKR